MGSKLTLFSVVAVNILIFEKSAFQTNIKNASKSSTLFKNNFLSADAYLEHSQIDHERQVKFC